MLKIIRMFAIIIAFCVNANLFAATKNDDVRILIDVSGSMKKTDPSNLRVPAMKLINGLIPAGAKAGVWTFGRYVNMTVKWGKVDENWRKKADQGVEEIHSNALFTNIESALERASKGWGEADPTTRRNLILLTDGQVDVSKDAAKNAKSRRDILEKNIKRLQEAGVRVQAIALSRDADEVLLKRLALETKGSFEIAETAADLQKIFLKMFERATSPDSINIEGNQFKVDSSIREMTLLVFRKPGSEPTVLFSPDSNRISARKKGGSVWRSDEGYDLITIKKPAKGVWNIDADIDPDNRLMVITDLQLNLTGLPAYVYPGQILNLSAALVNKGKQISKNSFLRFVEFNMNHIDRDGNEATFKLKHSDDRKRKGQYLYDFRQGLQEGTHTIMVTADSKTFNRSKRVDINVQWPVKVLVKPTNQAGSYDFIIEGRAEYMKPDSLQPTVFLETPDGKREALILENQSGKWAGVVMTNMDGIYQANVSIEAINQSGEALNLDMGKFPMLGFPGLSADAAGEKPGDQKNTDVTATAEALSANVEEEPKTDWVLTSIIIAVPNIILILIGFVIYMKMKRKTLDPEFLLE